MEPAAGPMVSPIPGQEAVSYHKPVNVKKPGSNWKKQVYLNQSTCGNHTASCAEVGDTFGPLSCRLHDVPLL